MADSGSVAKTSLPVAGAGASPAANPAAAALAKEAFASGTRTAGAGACARDVSASVSSSLAGDEPAWASDATWR
eukprot:9496814-Prorocentrum_lima.AAC.1